MFDRRLHVMFWTFVGATVVLVVRLGQLQVVQAGYYRQRAAEAVQLRTMDVPFVRGSILDRHGEVLAHDEACWDVTVDFRALAAAVGDGARPARMSAARRDALAKMWNDLASLTAGGDASSVDELRDRARRIYERVSHIRRAVARQRGFDAPVREEHDAHPLVSGLNEAEQIAARERLSTYPWVHVEPAGRRSFAEEAAPFAQTIGRLGRVTSRTLAEDPNEGDRFAEYRANELVGISGVEWAAEQTLRGRRGLILEDREGRVVNDRCIEPQRGKDVYLTLDAALTRRLYDRLREVVEAVPESSGGSIVVLDTAGRSVLALVSYPSYEPSRFDELYPALRDDTERFPLRFRAVANEYPPGSTIKPLVCLTGLVQGAITLQTREECRGYLFPGITDRWRCWQIHGTSQRKAHGMVDVVKALSESCNVFMYRLGEKLGVDRLGTAFDMVGIGRSSGMGLKEEAIGINPTPSWLMTHKNVRPTAGTARLFAIGQGEVAVTPVQVANLMATYATGRYRPVTLIPGDQPTPEWILPATKDEWRAIREGIYKAVNDPAGTAYEHARLDVDPHRGLYVLCAKTGSATAHPWPTAYRIPYIDADGAERTTVVRAGSKHTAMRRFAREYPDATARADAVEVAGRWPRQRPTPGEGFSHAWVGGFLQPCESNGQPDWSAEPPVAFAVLVEFGGSGGRIAGPLARRVAEDLLAMYGPELDFHPRPSGRATGETHDQPDQKQELTASRGLQPARTHRVRD